MKKFLRSEWKSLREEERDELLSGAVCVDATTCSTPTESMECIIDFENGLSAIGFYDCDTGKITVKEDSKIYDPAE